MVVNVRDGNDAALRDATDRASHAPAASAAARTEVAARAAAELYRGGGSGAGDGTAVGGHAPRMSARLEVVVQPVMGGGAGTGARPPPPMQRVDRHPSPDAAAMRAQLLDLISQHAGDELGVSAHLRTHMGGQQGAALPPPRLALQEAEARKAAAAEKDEAALRRHNAVHSLLKRVGLSVRAWPGTPPSRFT